MILWTIQPIEIWKMIQDTGVYRCDPKLSSMPEPEFVEKYDWLIRQMKKRIGSPPQGIVYPVWAWYKQNGKHKKPDLRGERWGYGPGDEDYTCIEFEIQDDQVLLSDFDSWHLMQHIFIAADVIAADQQPEHIPVGIDIIHQPITQIRTVGKDLAGLFVRGFSRKRLLAFMEPGQHLSSGQALPAGKEKSLPFGREKERIRPHNTSR